MAIIFSSLQTTVLCCSMLITALLVVSSPDHATMGQEMTPWMPIKASTTGSSCKGSMAECLAGGELEMWNMDLETSRRILATGNKYISYGALQRNSVPCSRRGSSYYNCRPGAEANPYTRSCSAITRCRG